MAYGTCRSNYFKVKDKDKFIEECAEVGVGHWEVEDGLVGVYSEGRNWPNCHPETDEDFDIGDFVASHLIDGEVAIFMEVEYENLRYLAGNAFAINSKGEDRYLSLEKIYDMAKELTDRPEDISRAAY